MRKFFIAVGILALLSGIGTVLSAQSELYTKRTCHSHDRGSVIDCGAFNQAELDARIQPDARKLFKDLGIPTDLSKAKQGVLYPQTGEIKVDGRVVATNASSYGRDSSQRSGFGESASPQAFRGIDATPVHVFFKEDGSFKVAIAYICGNPVIAKAKDNPKFSCDALEVTKINRTSFKFKTNYTAKDVTVQEVTYVVKDANGKEVYRGTKDTFSTNAPGAYTVESTLKVKLPNGDTKYVKSANCVKKFVVEPKDIKVCDLTTNKIITIKETEFDNKRHSTNLDDCKTIQVCELDTYKTITIHENQFDSKKHSKNFADCEKIEVCELDTYKTVTIRKTEFNEAKHSTNFEDCEKITVCELDTKATITIRKTDFDSSKHSTNFDDCKEIVVCELATDKVITIRKSEFDAEKHSTDLDDCERIEVCEIDTSAIVTIRKTEFDEAKHSTNLDDCKEIVVCEIETKNVITIRKSEFDETKHTTDLEVCKVEVCEIETKEIVKVDSDYDQAKYTTDLTKCEEESVTPEVPETPAPVITELPKTGSDNLVVWGLGLGSLVAAISYWGTSRRQI